MIKRLYLVGKMLMNKIRLFHGKEGRSVDSSSSTCETNMAEEYNVAFRTNSYLEMCNEVQGQFEMRCSDPFLELEPEPRQESLNSVFQTLDLHHLLAKFFQVTEEACRISQSIIQRIYQVRNSYYAVRNLDLYGPVVENPFSTITLENFHELRYRHAILLHGLTSECRKMKKKRKLQSCVSKTLFTAVAAFCVLAIVCLVFKRHSIGSAVSVTGLLVSSLVLFMIKCSTQMSERIQLEGQLDAAARAVYILMNDLATMGRLVQRIKNEMEHMKFVTEFCARKGKKTMKEVMRDLQMQGSCLAEHMEELEKHAYLCLLGINRSRKLVLTELSKP